MSRTVSTILRLADAVESFENISHWAVSVRVFGKGDKILRLRQGGDLTTGLAERALERFSKTWPEDLEWPSDIPRPTPEPSRKEASDA